MGELDISWVIPVKWNPGNSYVADPGTGNEGNIVLFNTSLNSKK